MGGGSWGGKRPSGTIQVSGDGPTTASVARQLAALEASVRFHIADGQVSSSPGPLGVSAAAPVRLQSAAPARLGSPAPGLRNERQGQ